MQKGLIYKIHSDFYYVHSEDRNYECKIREVLKKQKQKIFVGDYVEFDSGVIHKLLPRINYITRPSAANIDQVIIISSVKEPDLNFTQLNRYVAFSKYHNLKTVLCFNKNDLSENDLIIEKVFSIYEPLGFDILFTSAKKELGLEDFKKVIENKTSVLCGSSGVGKSSLINAICPNLNLKTKEISDKTKRGTHTTRHCEIMFIDEKSRIVDTPGFSNLQFDFLMPNEVDLLFDEISQYKSGCKFQDCLHIEEIGCAVKEHFSEIDETRYHSYLEFVKEAKEYKDKVKYQGTKQESSHKANHNKTVVKISSGKRQSARNTQKQNLYKGIENERID